MTTYLLPSPVGGLGEAHYKQILTFRISKCINENLWMYLSFSLKKKDTKEKVAAGTAAFECHCCSNSHLPSALMRHNNGYDKAVRTTSIN